MSSRLLNKAVDMQWLRDVHWPTLPKEYKSALITGNEDWPDAIAAYLKKDPLVGDTPLMWEPALPEPDYTHTPECNWHAKHADYRGVWADGVPRVLVYVPTAGTCAEPCACWTASHPDPNQEKPDGTNDS